MEHALTARADYCWNFQHESSVAQNSPKWRSANLEWTVQHTTHIITHVHEDTTVYCWIRPEMQWTCVIFHLLKGIYCQI